MHDRRAGRQLHALDAVLAEWDAMMNHARAVVAGWVDDFNTAQPHSAIGYMTPAAYTATLKPQRASALRHLESSAPMRVATVAPRRNSQPTIPVAGG